MGEMGSEDLKHVPFLAGLFDFLAHFSGGFPETAFWSWELEWEEGWRRRFT